MRALMPGAATRRGPRAARGTVRQRRRVSSQRCAARLAGLAALLLACGADAPRNVVLISVDTLRWDHVGLLGYARGTTPDVDAFFANSTVFENAMSPGPCTLPTLAQILYGSYLVQPWRLALAETLRARGYATAAFVSQHQFRPDWHDSGLGAELAESLTRGFDIFDVQAAEQVDRHGMSARDARQVSARALRWLSEGPREPFFLWLHYFDPHDPYEPPTRFRGFDRGNASELDGDRRLQLMRGRRSAEEPWTQAGHVFGAEDVAHLRNLYDGEIRFTDAQIGRILDALTERGLVERSVVVFVSDHGEWLGEGERWDHCQTLSEVEVRVPFFWSVGGGRLADLGRVTTPVSTLDLVPTLLALLGVDHSAEAFDGADLREPRPERPIFANWHGSTVARRGSWKLFVGEAPVALFDLDSDGAERRNRLGEGLAQEAQLARDVEAFRAAQPLAGLNREMLEHLRGLGYVD